MIALPHLYYLFHYDPYFSKLTFNDWCNCNVHELIQAFGPTTMFCLKAQSFLFMIRKIKVIKEHQTLDMVPSNPHFYKIFRYVQIKSAHLLCTLVYGHNLCPGLPNDRWVTRYAIYSAPFDELDKKIPMRRHNTSPDITGLLERVYPSGLWLSLNETVGSIAMMEAVKTNYHPFTDLIIEKYQQGDHSFLRCLDYVYQQPNYMKKLLIRRGLFHIDPSSDPDCNDERTKRKNKRRLYQ